MLHLEFEPHSWYMGAADHFQVVDYRLGEQ